MKNDVKVTNIVHARHTVDMHSRQTHAKIQAAGRKDVIPVLHCDPNHRAIY